MLELSVLEPYIQKFIYLITVLIPVGMLVKDMKRKANFWGRCVLCALIMITVVELLTYATHYIYTYRIESAQYVIRLQLFLYFSVFILSGVSVKVCFECDWWSAIFCANTGYCLQHIAAKLGDFFKDAFFQQGNWITESTLNVLISAVVYTGFYYAVLRKRKKNFAQDITNRGQILIAIVIININIFCNLIGLAYLKTFDLQPFGNDVRSISGMTLLLYIYVMPLVVAFIALLLNLGLSDYKQLSNELAVLTNLLDEGKKRLEYEKNTVEMINIKVHDIKHHLAAMKGKLYDEQISDLQEAITIYDSSIKTGNDTLDVLLAQKCLYCSQHGIRIKCVINGKNYDFIPRHELYTLFGNAIDNAIEGAETADDDKKIIYISECVRNNFYTVRIENCFKGECILKDGIPVSKKAAEGHGYGVKSMKLIAERHGGDISITIADNCFILDIYFVKQK